MSDEKPVELPPLDEPPKHYVDPHDALEDLSEEDAQKGVALGRSIDPDDDEDNGMRDA